ncbi:unnamed protein product [Litomosoides sigmodontis]|uniref:Uncharacterized protein n=1 Tax=Litomosoides sigmodontis TaxID=42156 RepID=A0A3P6STY4_LITSI|nr:unnamed protein product [Litomosoides sigmodontis]
MFALNKIYRFCSLKWFKLQQIDITPSLFTFDVLGNAFNEQTDVRHALDKRISPREYVFLSIADGESFPLAFIESFYPHLSSGRDMAKQNGTFSTTLLHAFKTFEPIIANLWSWIQFGMKEDAQCQAYRKDYYLGFLAEKKLSPVR